jgi:hypothetical protein
VKRPLLPAGDSFGARFPLRALRVLADHLFASVVVCGLVALLAAGCKDRKPPALQLAGLSAVPASAEVVVAADVARVVSSPLVTRAVDTLLLKDADLAVRWQKLQDVCKLDATKLKTVVLAIGPHAPDAQPGTGPVLMIVTGQLVETELADCVRSMVGQGGGTLTAKPVDGRTLYQAKDGKRTMFFAFSRPDTVVLGANEKFVGQALGTGPKLADNSELTGWIARADQKAPIWAAGRVDERVRGGLVRVTNNQLTAGPIAIILAVDPTDGAKIDVGAVMTSPADAKTLESFAKTQLGLLSMAAQAKSLGTVVQKVEVSTENQVTRFKANLDMNDVNLLISVLDGGPSDEQISPPATVPDAGMPPAPVPADAR